MACECEVKSVRAFAVGKGAAQCKGTVTVASKCEQAEPGGGDGDDDKMVSRARKRGERGSTEAVEDELGRALVSVPAPLAMVCRVTYQISVSPTANASVVQFTVDDEEFDFPAPIAPGKSDFVQIVRPKPADCDTQKNGKVKLSCAGGKTVVLDKFEVCVLA